jgi:hypothetical protein
MRVLVTAPSLTPASTWTHASMCCWLSGCEYVLLIVRLWVCAADCQGVSMCCWLSGCEYVPLNVRVWVCGRHCHNQMLCPHSCMGRPCLILGVRTWKLQWRVKHIATANEVPQLAVEDPTRYWLLSIVNHTPVSLAHCNTHSPNIKFHKNLSSSSQFVPLR